MPSGVGVIQFKLICVHRVFACQMLISLNHIAHSSWYGRSWFCYFHIFDWITLKANAHKNVTMHLYRLYLAMLLSDTCEISEYHHYLYSHNWIDSVPALMPGYGRHCTMVIVCVSEWMRDDLITGCECTLIEWAASMFLVGFFFGGFFFWVGVGVHNLISK